jgi:hypothetical protein
VGFGLRLRSAFGFEHEARAPKGLSAILTMAILTMAILTMAILTMAVLTMAIPLRVSAVPGCTPSAPW